MSKAKELLGHMNYRSKVINKFMNIFDCSDGDKVLELLKKRFIEIVPQLEDNMASLYEKFFTEEEIDLMIEWQKSPTALKERTLAPEISASYEIFIGELLQDVIKEIESDENL